MIGDRFIEESFPVKEVGAAAAKEKNIRHGHISTLHIWWARRPLAASRATAYAALTPAPADAEEWQRRRDFIIDLSQWENSLNPRLLDKARQEILKAADGHPPRILDPFAGGGSYPLEALRLGCEAYASDYNPVAVLLLKATLEYPQRFGHAVPTNGIATEGSMPWARPGTFNPLIEAVKKWGNWVLEESRQELSDFYPPDVDGSVPVGYIWARTIPCQNPACGSLVPLMRQFWLARKPNKHVALYPRILDERVAFSIVGDGYQPWPADFDPNNGTVSGAIATCPVCGAVVDDDTTRRLFQEGRSGQRLVAAVLHTRGKSGKTYRIATTNDELDFQRAAEALAVKRELLTVEWGMDPVPDESLSSARPSPNARGTSAVARYGIGTWGDLFNARQKLALITFAEKIRQAHAHMLTEGMTDAFAVAVATYLALIEDRLADYNSRGTRWVSHGGFVGNTFTRQALPMIWDYFELNPDSGATGDWNSALAWVLRFVEHGSRLPRNHTAVPCVTQSSATKLPYPDEHFDAILTDPPYYDNVPYSYLSDFFYVWLKRTIGHLYPELFSTPLTPKSGEIVAYTLAEGGFDAGTRFFEENLKLAFQEMYRVLKPNGIAVIVYAHNSTEGWETVINALLDSGLVASAAWPINTEMQSRVNANETASLASSIYIIARKMGRQPTGFYNEVRDELRLHLDAKLQRLWEEGIGGADFFIAAIGSAIEIFGKYERVIDYEGNVVRADRLLDEVRTIATDYAVRQILHNGFAEEISDLTRFYVLWRWNYGEVRVPFDEARKLAQSVGLDLTRQWGRGGFIRKDKEFVQVLGPQTRKLEDLDDAHELVDVLHRTLLLWEKGRRSDLLQTLAISGYGQSEAFYRVAQAVSETLPKDSREKKLLDGFLAGRERLRDEVGKLPRPDPGPTIRQARLWEDTAP